MNKNLSGIPSSTSFPSPFISLSLASSSKPSSKSKNPLRGSYGKLTLDLNKFELRSIAPSTTTASGSQPFSPTGIPLEKVSLITNMRKSPRTGHPPISFPTDGLESKETYTIDNKIFPQTTKASSKGYVGLSVDKTKKTNERVASPKQKDSHLKSSGLSYEAFLNKRGSQQQTKESLKTELGLNRGDSKTRITEETAKKGGVSSSLTLNTVYTSVGSNSHRAQISSPVAGEHGNANRPYMYVPLHRRNSQKSESDFLQQYQLQSNTINSTKGYVATNFTIDQSMTSQDQIKNVSKLNMNSISNAFTTEKTISSPKEGPGYNGLIKMINKDSGSSSATQDKKIKATIGMLTEEIDSFKRMKNQLREKERLIETLQYSICEAVKDSDNLRKELQKSNLMPYDITPSTSESPAEHKRTKKNLSIGDMETVKTLVSQLKALTECSEEIQEGNSRVGTSKPKSKRPESSYSSGGFDHILEKNSAVDLSGGTSGNNVNIYQRHYSGTFEDTYGSKAMESPYYEALKTISRKEETHHNHSSKPSTANSKKASSISKKASPDVRKTGNSGMASQKDKDSLLGTPRKIQVESTRIAKQPRTQHNTMTGGELDILKRKFSHDPRVISEGTGDLFAKKHSGAEAGSTLAYTTEKESSGENIDIGKSLGMLKDRIANLLFRHKDDNRKLKETFCANLQKFEGLLQNQN